MMAAGTSTPNAPALQASAQYIASLARVRRWTLPPVARRAGRTLAGESALPGTEQSPFQFSPQSVDGDYAHHQQQPRRKERVVAVRMNRGLPEIGRDQGGQRLSPPDQAVRHDRRVAGQHQHGESLSQAAARAEYD